MIRFYIQAGIFIIVVGMVMSLYWLGLDSGYLFDDSHVLENNRYIKITNLDWVSLVQAANSFSAGGREFSMLSFALNYYFFGDSTWWLKFVNLVIHCLNGLGILVLCNQIKSRLPSNLHAKSGGHAKEYWPIMVAVLWLVHPINLIPVLYISQRMALLSAIFILYGLIFYLWARTYITDTSRKIIYLPLGIAAFTIIGFKCKENAALLPLFILALEICILKFRFQNKRDNVVAVLFGCGAVLIIALITYQILQDPNWIIGGYKNRYFSLQERLMTEFRVLVYYISQILVPSNQQLSLWHDDFTISANLLSPVTTLYSLLALIGLLIAALAYIQKLPLFSLGVFWFFVSHAIESTVLPLELVHEHRNYLASFAILLGIVNIICSALKSKRRILHIIVIGLFLFYSLVLFERARIWRDSELQALHNVRYHPKSPIANFTLGKMYYINAMEGTPKAAEQAFEVLSRSIRYDQYSIILEMLLVLLSEHEEVDFDHNWLVSATEKIKKYPFIASSKTAFRGLIKCVTDKKCNPPKESIIPIIEAAENSTDPYLQTAAGTYYLHVEKDLDKTEQAFRRAAAQDKPRYWINLVLFLIDRKKPQEACNAYKQFIKNYEDYGYKHMVLLINEITYLEQKLENCVTTFSSQVK